MSNPNDANIIVNGQKVVATVAQSGTVVKDGGEIDATSIIQTSDGLQKVVKVMDVNGGGGGGSATWGSITGTLSDQTDLKTALDTKLQNTATGTNSLTIGGNPATSGYCLNIGAYTLASNSSVAIGIGTASYQTSCVSIGAITNQGKNAIAIGPNGGTNSVITGNNAIQLGKGDNSVANLFQVYTFPMLDGNTGKIPNERISAPIVIEKADDGNGNGYRLWSDGWLEQYGVYDNQAKSNDFYTTVNFTKTFENAFYFSTVQAFNLNESEAFRDGSTDIYAKTTSSISFGFYRSGSGDGYRYISWKCEGYIQTEP